MTCSKSRRDFGGGEGAGERTGWMTDRIIRGGLEVWWLGICKSTWVWMV